MNDVDIGPFGVSNKWLLDVVNRVMNYGNEPKPHDIIEITNLMLKECTTVEEVATVCFHCGELKCRLEHNKKDDF